MPNALAPRLPRDNAGETMRGILLAVLACIATSPGDVTGQWALGAAGVAGAAMGRGLLAHARAPAGGRSPLLPAASPPSGGVLLALRCVGLLNGIGHQLPTRGHPLTPCEHALLIWDGIAGFTAFWEVPGWSSLAGAAVVAAAGLRSPRRERVRRGEVLCS